MMLLKFYKDPDGRWYADLPEYINSGGSKADCEMVCGADTLLDIIAQDENETYINFSVQNYDFANVLHLTDLAKNPFDENSDGGAHYFLHEYDDIDYALPIWLCPVTLFVFGEYPNKIYFNKVG